jgi:large subunit ribosomal protein L2
MEEASDGTRQSQTDLAGSPCRHPGRQSDLHKGEPVAALLEPQSKNAGRNNNGHVTTRHQGGGHKQHYRLVDFKRNKDGVPAKVERLEYDPNRTANIALLCYADGERRYIIAPKGLTVGQQVSVVPRRRSRRATLCRFAIFRSVRPSIVSRWCRARVRSWRDPPGTSVQLLAREGVHAQLRLRSGEIRRVHVECRATIGEVGNEEHSLRSIGKAGGNRWRGIRPTVRGVAMNPIDHPHGGGEGKTGIGDAPGQSLGYQDQRLSYSSQQAHDVDDRAAPSKTLRDREPWDVPLKRARLLMPI